MKAPMFEVIREEAKKDYGRFVISPLEQGYGDTLGNSLRRVLLISLPGAAITLVKIAGVKHQFSTLKGMKEDVIEFLLNLKKVRFTYKGDKKARAVLSARGPGVVVAKDIKVPADVSIANPDFKLAILEKAGKLEADMEIEVGTGYSPGEGRPTGEIGAIPLDASFSPVTRVNYRVEETRVGRFTNYDKLIFEIWTDGTISPKDALSQAGAILVSYFNQVVSPKKVVKKIEETKDLLGPAGKLSLEEIGLPTRVANALMRAGYETVEQLVKAKREDLVKVRNLGEKSLKIVAAALAEKGTKLAEK